MPTTTITPAHFVAAYMQNDWSVKKTAMALGMSEAAAYARYKSYSKAGVKFPKTRKRANRLDVKELNNLIVSYKTDKTWKN